MSLLESQLTDREKELRLAFEGLLNETSIYLKLIGDGTFPYPVDEAFNKAEEYAEKTRQMDPRIRYLSNSIKMTNMISITPPTKPAPIDIIYFPFSGSEEIAVGDSQDNLIEG